MQLFKTMIEYKVGFPLLRVDVNLAKPSTSETMQM